jgi:hypothetical protein
LYAAWRYSTLSAADAATFKAQGLSVAAVLGKFRDEWRRSQEEAEVSEDAVIAVQMGAIAAPGTSTHPAPK